MSFDRHILFLIAASVTLANNHRLLFVAAIFIHVIAAIAEVIDV